MNDHRSPSTPPDIPPPPDPLQDPPRQVDQADRTSGIMAPRDATGTSERIGWGVALVAIGTLWLLSVAGVAIRWELLVPIALIVVGVLVLTRPRGRGDGPIWLGILLLIVAAATATMPTVLPISVGERTHTITGVADLAETYTLGAGQLELDLSGLDPAELSAVAQEVRAQVIFGELIVRVPEGTRLAGDAQVVFGEVDHFGRTTGGIVPRADLAGSGEPDAAEEALDLDLRVIFGRIEVDR